MNRELKKSIDRWLETARKGELLARRDRAYELLREVRDPGMKAALRAFIRAVDEEIVARAGVFEFVKRTDSRRRGLKAV